MPTLLVLSATPHGAEDSHTLRLGTAYLAALHRSAARLRVELLDLFGTVLPPVDAAGPAMVFGQRDRLPAVWRAEHEQARERLTAQFAAADRYLVVTPLPHGDLPGPLTHYFEIVVRHGQTADQGNDAPLGLRRGRRADVLVTRGEDRGIGARGTVAGRLESRLRTLFGLVGVTDVRIVPVEGGRVPAGDERTCAAIEAVGRLAQTG